MSTVVNIDTEIAEELIRWKEDGPMPGPKKAPVDDTEVFVEDAPEEPSTELPPVGEVELLNGAVYKPRTIGVHEDLAFIRAARDEQEHILFYGPPGTGKTVGALAPFVEYAERVDPTDKDSLWLHEGIETIVCSENTQESDFMGTFIQNPNTGMFEWVPGPLHRAVMYDIPLYVDEIFLADTRVLSSVLYPLMDGRGVLRITANPELAPIKVGKGFFVIGAGNPDVPGAIFSEALRDRFEHHIEVTTDWRLARELKVPSKMVTVAQNLDKQRQKHVISWSPQLRSLLAFAKAENAYGTDYAVRALVGKAPIEDQGVIMDAINAHYSSTVDKLSPLSMGSRHKTARTKK